MKQNKQQKQRLTNLYEKYKKLVKGRAKVTREKLWTEYKVKKLFLIESFKKVSSEKREVQKLKTQKKKAIIQGKPYLSKQIASGSFDIWELPHKQKVLENETLINDFVKRQIKQTNKKIRYIHIIVEYKDELWGENNVMSDVYSLFYAQKTIDNGESLFMKLFDKYQTVARAKESDWTIDKVTHILIKFIYEPQTDETSRGEEKNG